MRRPERRPAQSTDRQRRHALSAEERKKLYEVESNAGEGWWPKGNGEPRRRFAPARESEHEPDLVEIFGRAD